MKRKVNYWFRHITLVCIGRLFLNCKYEWIEFKYIWIVFRLNLSSRWTNRIALDGKIVKEVETFTYMGSITVNQGESGTDVKARIDKASGIPRAEENVELKTTVGPYQCQNLKNKHQDSCTIRRWNFEDYWNHHQKCTSNYRQLFTYNTPDSLAGCYQQKPTAERIN